MFRLAHISDVHLAPLPQISLRQLLSKRITGYLNWQRNRKGKLNQDILSNLLLHLNNQNTDHLAITGDLVNLAMQDEFSHAHRWLQGIGAPQDISVVLGNHDCYVPSGYSDACYRWRDYLGDETSNSLETLFPYTRYRGDIALIGTNSGVATPPFMATGKFDRDQAEKLRSALIKAKTDGKFRVILIHHPPVEGAASWAKKLNGQKAFRSVVSEVGAELVLHGHTHLDSLNWIEGHDGSVPVVGVPSASQTPTPENSIPNNHQRPPARYNLFEIDGSPKQWRCKFRQFGYWKSNSGIQQIGEAISL